MTALEMLTALTPNAAGAGDGVLEALVAAAEADFMAECSRDDVPEAASGVIWRMAAHRFGQLDAAGLQSQSYSGASESFLADYPDDLKRAMHRFRKLRLL